MHRFVKQLGLQTNYNYFAVGHTFACPSVDSFFSIGSVSAKRDNNLYRYDGQDSYDSGLKFYANDNVLPLAFAANKAAMDFDYYRLEKDASEKNYYSLQNDWYRSLFPDAFSEDFFIEMDESVTGAPKITNGVFFNLSNYLTREDYIKKNSPSSSTSDSENKGSDPLGLEKTVDKQLKDNITKLYRENENIPIAVEYEFKAPDTREIYCSLVSGRILDSTEVFVNGIEISEFSSNAFYSQIFRIGSFAEGETVKVSFLCNVDSWSYLNVRFAAFDNEAFASQFAKVDTSKVTPSVVSDGYAKFDISGLGSDETVITTIPAEDGWQLYIDGAPSDYKLYQDAFISFDTGSGSHTAELVFTAPGLKTGAAVTCVGIVLLAAFVVIDKKVSKMKEKQDQN